MNAINNRGRLAEVVDVIQFMFCVRSSAMSSTKSNVLIAKQWKLNDAGGAEGHHLQEQAVLRQRVGDHRARRVVQPVANPTKHPVLPQSKNRNSLRFVGGNSARAGDQLEQVHAVRDMINRYDLHNCFLERNQVARLKDEETAVVLAVCDVSCAVEDGT